MGTPTPGPGKFSQRTDKAVSEANRSLPNAGYGEQATYQADQQGLQSQAPSAPAPDLSTMLGSPNVTGLGEDTTQPETPVTDGAASGPGAGPEVLSSSQAGGPNMDKLKAYLPALEYMADSGNSDAARNLVRQIQSQTM